MSKTTAVQTATTGSQAVATQQDSPGVRFMHRVIQSASGLVKATDSQKSLMQSYYLAIDQALKTAEGARLAKNDQYRDPIPVTWANVNMELLATRVMAYSKIGLDPSQPNHLSFVPHKNKSGKYDITFIEGYRGKEVKAKKYGLDVPTAITVELVYKNDKFRILKKDARNPVESYEFEVVSPFDRGEIVGGFYYHQFANDAAKNKVVVMSSKDIEKRKPKYASVEFWGGSKDEWKNGQKTGKTEVVEGWKDEMYKKTVTRAAYNDITIDATKIDEEFNVMVENNQFLAVDVQEEIAENAHKEVLTIDAGHTEVKNNQYQEMVLNPNPDPLPEWTNEPPAVEPEKKSKKAEPKATIEQPKAEEPKSDKLF